MQLLRRRPSSLMASKQTYPCFACKKAGFDNVMVLLDGKTADGKTIYKNPDMTAHIHKSSNDSSTVSAKTSQTSTFGKESLPKEEQQPINTNALLKIIIAELQRLIKLFEEQQQK